MQIDHDHQWQGTTAPNGAPHPIQPGDASNPRSHADPVLTELERTRLALQRALAEIDQLRIQVNAGKSQLLGHKDIAAGNTRLVGQSAAIRKVLAQAQQVAPTDSTVLLLGETGTGKELLATIIHEASPRSCRPLVPVNCAGLPGPLVESELFGRERGAFTGALTRQSGRFEIADGSTIFLDEISEIPLETQAKLLRVLEERQFERLGNPRPIPVNVRVIAASNQDLDKAVRESKFRQDLFYRLNVFPIVLPPLRERREDIPLLVWAFVDEFAKTFHKNIESIQPESIDALQRYSWPGNVRELRNTVERAMILANGPKLRIPPPVVQPQPLKQASLKMADVERDHLLRTLVSSGWRIRGPRGAAAILGFKATTLEARMARLGIRRPTAGPN